MDYKKQKMLEKMQENQKEKELVEKLFDKTGDCDSLISNLRKIERDKPNINELPF